MTFPFWFGSSSDLPPNSGGEVSGPASRASARDTLEGADTLSRVTDADKQLIEQIRAGEEVAFASLVRTYAQSLTRFAYDYIGSAESAEDLVNEVFIWIWEHRTTWKVTSSIRSYLFSAVRNRAISARRSAAYHFAWIARHPGEPSEAGMAAAPRDAATVSEIRELGVILRDAIDMLSEGRRTAILLHWMEEMSYAEIAAVMGTSVVGVKQQLNRALRDLREILPAYVK